METMPYSRLLDGDVDEDEDEDEKEPGPAVKLVRAIWEHAQVDALNDLLQEHGLDPVPRCDGTNCLCWLNFDEPLI